MNACFGNWREFLEGEVFSGKFQQGRAVRAILRKSGRRIFRTAVEFTVGGAIIFATTQIPLPGANAAPPATVFSEDSHYPSTEFRSRFRSARESLGLSQVEAAKMLRVSESSLEKFEVGAVMHPSPVKLERYTAIIRLADLYLKVAGTKRHLIKSFLRTPSYVYGGKSAIEFAASRESGIFDVVGMERRTHA